MARASALVVATTSLVLGLTNTLHGVCMRGSRDCSSNHQKLEAAARTCRGGIGNADVQQLQHENVAERLGC